MSTSRLRLHENFAGRLGDHWHQCRTGSASLDVSDSTLRLVNSDTVAGRYSNAQIDDDWDLPRARFPWSPPLTLTVRARISHPGPMLRGGYDFIYQPAASGGPILSGTAGFGSGTTPFLRRAGRWSRAGRGIAARGWSRANASTVRGPGLRLGG